MKSRDGSAPDLARSTRAGARPRTEEFDLADGNEHGDDDRTPDDASPRAIANPMQTAEIDMARDRRVTLTSPIPAILADAMVRERMVTPRSKPVPMPRRDPAAPVPEPREQTRRVGDSDPVRAGSGPAPGSDVGVAPWRQRAAQRIDEARAAMDAGGLGSAVMATEAALREADEAPAPGIIEVIEPARPLLNRVLATYVGPTSGLPILAPRADDVAPRLGDRERALLRRIDGQRTLEELFDGSGIGAMDALRIVARLIRVGAIRIV
jgi:hypothetical protein